MLLRHQSSRHIGENCRQLRIGCGPCASNIEHTVHETDRNPKILPVKSKTREYVCEEDTNNIEHIEHDENQAKLVEVENQKETVKVESGSNPAPVKSLKSPHSKNEQWKEPYYMSDIVHCMSKGISQH